MGLRETNNKTTLIHTSIRGKTRHVDVSSTHADETSTIFTLNYSTVFLSRRIWYKRTRIINVHVCISTLVSVRAPIFKMHLNKKNTLQCGWLFYSPPLPAKFQYSDVFLTAWAAHIINLRSVYIFAHRGCVILSINWLCNAVVFIVLREEERGNKNTWALQIIKAWRKY